MPNQPIPANGKLQWYRYNALLCFNKFTSFLIYYMTENYSRKELTVKILCKPLEVKKQVYLLVCILVNILADVLVNILVNILGRKKNN